MKNKKQKFYKFRLIKSLELEKMKQFGFVPKYNSDTGKLDRYEIPNDEDDSYMKIPTQFDVKDRVFFWGLPNDLLWELKDLGWIERVEI